VSNILEDIELIDSEHRENLKALDVIKKKRVDDLRKDCDHDLGDWESFFFKDGAQSCKRGCSLCGFDEFMSFDRAVKLLNEMAWEMAAWK